MEETLSGELDSEMTGLNKDESLYKKKKLIIVISSAIALSLVILLIILVVTSPKNKKPYNNSDESEEGEEEEEEKGDDIRPEIPYIGELNAIYEVQTISQNTLILGKEYSKTSDFNIYIDEKPLKYTKEYQFSSLGKHILSIKLHNI